MPIFEFKCKKCLKEFETLILDREKPACPFCSNTSLEKKFSTFASGSSKPGGGAKEHGSSCSCCSSKKNCPDYH
jgi:putative FmdB family regulatory protein